MSTETPQALAARLRQEVDDDAARLVIKREALAEAEKAAARKTVGQRVAEAVIQVNGGDIQVGYPGNQVWHFRHSFGLPAEHGCQIMRAVIANAIDAACLRQREACVNAVQKAWVYGFTYAPLIKEVTSAILAAEVTDDG